MENPQIDRLQTNNTITLGLLTLSTLVLGIPVAIINAQQYYTVFLEVAVYFGITFLAPAALLIAESMSYRKSTVGPTESFLNIATVRNIFIVFNSIPFLNLITIPLSIVVFLVSVVGKKDTAEGEGGSLETDRVTVYDTGVIQEEPFDRSVNGLNMTTLGVSGLLFVVWFGLSFTMPSSEFGHFQSIPLKTLLIFGGFALLSLYERGLLQQGVSIGKGLKVLISLRNIGVIFYTAPFIGHMISLVFVPLVLLPYAFLVYRTIKSD